MDLEELTQKVLKLFEGSKILPIEAVGVLESAKFSLMMRYIDFDRLEELRASGKN